MVGIAQLVEQRPFKAKVRGSSPRRVTKKKDTTFVVSFFLSCAPMRWRSPSKPKMLSRSEFYLRWGFLSVAKMRIQYKSAAPLRRYLALYTTKATSSSHKIAIFCLQRVAVDSFKLAANFSMSCLYQTELAGPELEY